jgi:hypothetical protein
MSSYLFQILEKKIAFSRFGIGRFTTEEEVDYTAERCILEVNR